MTYLDDNQKGADRSVRPTQPASLRLSEISIRRER